MRTVIIGNSGSGKSTLAKALAGETQLPVLDLDTIVWEQDRVAVARDRRQVIADLERFCKAHEHWIIEGCYAECAQATLRYRPELVFIDPGEETCLAHCRARPWEPHKYASKAEQDAKLEFLLGWVAGYYTRDDDMSHAAHRALYDAYDGPKRLVTRAPEP